MVLILRPLMRTMVSENGIVFGPKSSVYLLYSTFADLQGPRLAPAMRKDALLQASLAVAGTAFIMLWWQPDAKWPNPFRSSPADKAQ